MKKILFLSFLTVTFVSCIKTDLYEKQAVIPAQQWFYSYVPEFTFHITDTASLYNIYVVLRHTDLYKYNNIWLRVGIKSSSDSMKFQNVNIVLATDSKGWEGAGMGDIFEVRKNISSSPLFFKTPGDYTVSIAQIMRENPLSDVLNIGVRIEKLKM